jgi:hypothetical protein
MFKSATRPSPMRPTHTPRHGVWLTLAVATLALAGCEQTGPASGTRLYHADFQGKATRCTPSTPTITAGQTTDATITQSGDGWCGILVHQPGPKPYDAGLLLKRPAHGDVLIHSVGDDTRIDYTPDRRATGPDAFTVRLLPGNADLHVAVTVAGP